MLPQKTFNGITFKIRHTMLPVSNMERTVDFYTRLLGMDVQRVRTFLRKAERVRYLGYGNDEDSGPALELIESAESRAKAPTTALDRTRGAFRFRLLQAVRDSSGGTRAVCQRSRTEPARQ